MNNRFYVKAIFYGWVSNTCPLLTQQAYLHENLRISLPTFKGNELIVFYPDKYITSVATHTQDNAFKGRPEGELLKENGNWFILSEKASPIKLPRVNSFYRIPKKYLARIGYSYYYQISQLYQLPLIGYLSPKEYLDFLNLQILDFLSLKPIWSPS